MVTESSLTLQICSPYDQSPIDELALTPWETIDDWVEEATRYFRDRTQWLKPWQRIEILTRLAALLEPEAEHLAQLIAREGGKPVTDARLEVTRAIEGVRYAAGAMAEVMRGGEIASGLNARSEHRRMQTIREPIGPVLAIGAFNHPLNLIIHQVIPAVAVGCPVIVKPASATPLTCRRLIDLLYKAGLPPHGCRMILCPREQTERLCADARFAFVSYIGSAAVGWRLRRLLAPGTRCALEHGGNAPVILLPDADQSAAIPALLKGGMTHAGQVCVSVQRVYVPWAEAAGFARALAMGAEALKLGNPLNDTTEVGPLIRTEAVAQVGRHVQQALLAGAKLMTGGEALQNNLYQPTILLDAPDSATVTREEIFGPVISVYGYDELDEAIERCNASRYAFQAAIWGREHDRLLYAAERLDAATVLINDHTAFRVDWMPFGGRRESGLGVGGIPYTMRDYSQEKLIVTRI